MRIFIWTMLAMFVVETAGKICMLWTRDYRIRTPGMTAFEAIVGLFFVWWAAYLLGQNR